MPPVLLDNTVLTNFAIVRRTDLPGRLWADAVCTTPAALAEYQQGVAAGYLPAQAWSELGVVALDESEITAADAFSVRLGAGESECIAVAANRGGLFVSDDLDAREVARRQAIVVTGTLGILAFCVQRSILNDADADRLLADMVQAGYRSPVSKLGDLLRE